MMLCILCAGATMVGVAMFGAKHHRKGSQSNLTEIESEISALRRENAVLRDHNARLKALVTADAPVDMPEGTVKFVEKALGFGFSAVPLAFMRSEEILEEAASQFWVATIGHDSMLARNYAMEALGLLPAMSDLLHILTQQTYKNRLVAYDPSSHEIILDLRFDSENDHHQAQLIHACSIALMAEKLSPWIISNNDDARISQIAVLHASASSISQEFYAKASRLQGIPLQASNPNLKSSHNASELLPNRVNLGAEANFEKLLTHFFRIESHTFLHMHPNFLEKPSQISSLAVLNTHKKSAPEQSKTIIHAQKTHQEDADSDTELVTKLGVLAVLSYAGADQIRDDILSNYESDQLVIVVNDEGKCTTTWTIAWANEKAAVRFLDNISIPETVQVQHKQRRVTLHVQHSSAEN